MKPIDVLPCAILAGCLAAGCVRFEPRPIAPDQVADTFDRRTLADVGLKAFLQTNLPQAVVVWPLPTWDLADLTLAAFYYQPDLDVARANWASVRAGKITAAERPNPSISAAPTYNTTTRIPSPWLATVTLDIPIETAGKRGYRIVRASQLSEAARLNIASVAWQVRGRVRRSWVDLYTSQETVVLLGEQQVLQAENLRLLEQQYRAGAISAFEVTQARLAADAARLALREAERQVAESRIQLADAIGIPVRALDGVELSFKDLDQTPPEIPPATARRQALLNRADVLGALAEYAASESALQLEIARQYPDVHINPGYEFDQGDNKWSVGLTVTLPILNQNRGAIAEADARRAQVAASFVALQAHVVAEIDRAVAACRVALLRKADTDALHAHLQTQEKAAQAMLEAGAISKAELAALRLQISASAVARLDALAKSQQAFGALEDALQSPLGLASNLFPTNLSSAPRPSQEAGP